MIRIDVWCQNEECEDIFPYYCESEDAGDQSEHKAECISCGFKTTFNITYEPVAIDERLAEDAE